MPAPKTERPDSHTRAQRSYQQRQRDRGLVRLSVYVPDEDRDTFYKAIDKLRIRWRKMGYEV